MKVFPLAIYTADHGLAWNYPRDEIDFQEIDACRKAFGPLPDFDAGAKGFSGVWATGKRVFIMRCQSVSAWDFRGRNATYFAVTWIPRSEAAATDFGRILDCDALRTPTKTPPPFFQMDASRNEVPAQAPQPYLNDGFERIGGVIAATNTNQKVAAKRVDGMSQVTCVVTNPQNSSPMASVAPQAPAASGKTRTAALQPLSVPMVASAAIAILAVGVAVVLGMKAFYLSQENEELKNQLAQAQDIHTPQNVFEEDLSWHSDGILTQYQCQGPFLAIDYTRSIWPTGRIVIFKTK